MKYCPKCEIGGWVDDVFCRFCGVPLLEYPKCSKCDADMGSAKFCGKCGFPKVQNPEEPAEEDENKE